MRGEPKILEGVDDSVLRLCRHLNFLPRGHDYNAQSRSSSLYVHLIGCTMHVSDFVVAIVILYIMHHILFVYSSN
uniref:Uncharacterized protein n=1 Tax=Arundo donax TaxID=35708 RepID=A0A0A9ED23_ARUDO